MPAGQCAGPLWAVIMLAPEYLAGLPDRLVALYAAVEQDILLDMARRIREYDFYIPAAQHQHQRLRAMGMAEEEIEAVLSTLSGRSREELKRLMEQAVEKSLSADAAVYAAAGMGPVDPLAAVGVRIVLRSGLAQTGGVFENLTRTTARTATKQFENALDLAWLQITSGGFDYNTAIRNAIKDLARQGIGAITYPSGHTDTLEVAVRRAVVTGCNQTAAKAQIALMDDLGVDLVETTAHRGARPSHQVWQGRIFSRSGRSDKYPDFVSSTGYGTGPGLCGWNCSHSFGPYIEGAPRAYSPAILERYATQTVSYNGKELTMYEAGQQQRYIERQIRRWKRELAAMNGAGLDTGDAAAKLSAWRAREKDFCRQTGLKRQGERSQISGFGKSEASKTIAATKAVEKRIVSAYNKRQEEIRTLIRSDATPKSIHAGRQNKHIKSSKRYISGRSYIYGDLEEAQRLVNQYHGTGRATISRSGKWTNKEIICSDKVIGVAVDPSTGKETETHRFAIHYSKNGTHIVPAEEK